MPWNCVRNSDRLSARFLCAVEEALSFGPAHMELEARHVRMNPVQVHLHNFTALDFYYLADLAVFSSGQSVLYKVMSLKKHTPLAL